MILSLLHINQFGIVTVEGVQFLMRAAFHDLSFVHDADRICMLDSRQTVCHDEGGTFRHQVFERFLYQFLGFAVQRRCG